MDLEKAFLLAIQESPCEDTPWLALADWLEERGDPRAELVRLQITLRRPAITPGRARQEERLRELLASGVRPLVPMVTNSIGMLLALVPPGAFLMGSPPDEAGRGDDEHQHEVEITRPFYAGIYPVTQEQYQRIMGKPSQFSFALAGWGEGPDRMRSPVESVSWDDAVAFCRCLSELSAEKAQRRTYHLPTEAEWEYLCRGGPFFKAVPTAFCFGDSLSDKHANTTAGAAEGRYVGHPSPVGSYPPNALGLHDMHGNVWEWCGDWYDPDYYRRRPRRDPRGAEQGDVRVLRGGSWGDPPRYCRSAYRGNRCPTIPNSNIGFRVVLRPE